MVQVLRLTEYGFNTRWVPAGSTPHYLIYRSGPDIDGPYTPIRFEVQPC